MILPYIGVSNLSCIMCSHYIRAFNEVTQEKIATRGSCGKAYYGLSGLVFQTVTESFARPF